MKEKILVTKPIPKDVEHYLREYCDVTVWNSNKEIPECILTELLKDVKGLITTNMFSIYYDDKIYGAFSVSVPEYRISSTVEDEIVESVLKTKANILREIQQNFVFI